ncbi:MAG: thymidylate kinase [Candidatus Sumerlaeota bacterium]|nr:thymidylate kinase [Candidatus Sumerlaeota bacterium]
MKRAYGQLPPNVNPEELHGKLIVIEGPDGSGRSTQVRILQDWLERGGHAMGQVGLRRSSLVAAELDKAKQGNILGRTTMSLFYATDFYDQLENQIIPWLRAGMIVVADRYIYTLMARDIVRGADEEWVETVYSGAIVPGAIFYLKVSPQEMIERNLRKRASLDYWESGMDIALSRDMFESFVKYQRLIRREFQRMEKKYNFITINANRGVRSIAREIEFHLGKILDGGVEG